MQILAYILIALGSYLLGSIPTGFLVARSKGIDIRSTGSGNIGATNVFRIVGKGAGIFVLLVDALKGFVGCFFLCPLILKWIAPQFPGFLTPGQSVDLEVRFEVVAGVCAILGHNYSCWLKFKGGKGVATSAGVFLALTPIAASAALVVWIVVVALTRYVSVASMAAAVMLPLATWLFMAKAYRETQGGVILQSVTIAAGLMIIVKHRSNIQRLRAGTEKRITFKNTGATQ